MGAVAALALVVAACGGSDKPQESSSESGPSAQNASPVKIGVILPYSGVFGQYGTPMETALKARFSKDGNKVAGRTIELIFEDDATDPGTAVTKARKLVDRDKVSSIVCCVDGGATLAVAPYLAEQRVPQIGPIPNPAGLEKFPTAFLLTPTAGQMTERFGKYAAQKLGWKNVVIVASDFSYGRDVADSFERGFISAGGKITQKLFPPQGTQDYGSFLTQIRDADAVFTGFGAADAIRFIKQYEQFGLKGKIRLSGHGPIVTELILAQMGDSAIGTTAVFHYSSQLDTPNNKAFLQALSESGANIIPSHFVAGSWAAGETLIAMLRAVNGNTSNVDNMLKALKDSQIDSPWGPFRFDSNTRYANSDLYYYEVVKQDDKLVHKILDKVP